MLPEATPNRETGLRVRHASGTVSLRYAVAAALYAAVIGWIVLNSLLPLAARADNKSTAGKSTVSATGPSIADELAHLGALKFNTRLQDASDENVFDDLPVVVTISDVVSDSPQCHISYRERVEREEHSRDEQRSLALTDIIEVKVEPFESFGEHEGKPGSVYTMTDPAEDPGGAAARAHIYFFFFFFFLARRSDDMTDWFVIRDTEMAKRLAEDIRRRGDYCRAHAAP